MRPVAASRRLHSEARKRLARGRGSLGRGCPDEQPPAQAAASGQAKTGEEASNAPSGKPNLACRDCRSQQPACLDKQGAEIWQRRDGAGTRSKPAQELLSQLKQLRAECSGNIR